MDSSLFTVGLVKQNREDLKQLGKRKLDIQKDLTRLLYFALKNYGGNLSTARDGLADQERQLDTTKQKIRAAEHPNKD